MGEKEKSQKQLYAQNDVYKKPALTFLKILLIVFISELVSMSAVSILLPSLPKLLAILLDSLILVILIGPVFFLLLYRPLLLINKNLEQLDNELETKIQERTKEISESNNLLWGEIVKKNRLVSIIENTIDYVGTTDTNNKLLFLNKAGRRMVGIGENEDISNLSVSDMHPQWADEIILNEGIPNAISKGAWAGVVALLTRDGHEIPVSQVLIAHRGEDNSIKYLSTIMRDITERKQAEDNLKLAYKQLKDTQDKLIQSVKIATIGQLAGSIVHQLNNPLTGVLNNVQLIRMEIELKKESGIEDFKELLAIIEESALRCKDITQSLLDLSHTSKGVFQPLSFNTLIDKILTIVYEEMKLDNIIIQKDLQPDLVDIKSDRQLLEEVIMILISNAQWGSNKRWLDKKGGIIIIKTSQEPEYKSVT